MTWQVYAIAVLVFGLLSCVPALPILRLQGVLPLNPTHAPGMSPLLAFNTAISFVTGTNWQAYEGETQASYLADMAGLVVAQFTAAAVGLAVALAVVRGIAGSSPPDRQLLGGLHPVAGPGVRPAVGHRRARPGQPGRGAELQRVPHREHAGRRDPADPRRSGRLDGGHQAARHQRRQHVRGGRRAPVREPDRLHEPLRPAAGHRAAVRDHRHVRPPDRPPQAGAGHHRRDGGDLPRRTR